MNNPLVSGNSYTSFEEENEQIRRFLLTLDSEIAENQISPSAFQDIQDIESELPRILENFFQNLYVRENYINILISIIKHIFDRDCNLLRQHQQQNDSLFRELELAKEQLETVRRQANDLESAYEREEKAKNELSYELGSLEDRSQHFQDLLSSAKGEIEDYKDILQYYKEVEESLKRTKDSLKRSQAENIRLKCSNDGLEKKMSKMAEEIEGLKQKFLENQENSSQLSKENKRLKKEHRNLSQDFEQIIAENEKINERNNELILKLSSAAQGQKEKGSRLEITEIEESECTDPENDLENQFPSQKVMNKKTSIDGYLSKPERNKKAINEGICINVNRETIEESTQEDLVSKAHMPNQQSKTMHHRTGSLFTEIIELKKNEIIDVGVFEEGLEKIQRLNVMKEGWVRVSELEIKDPNDDNKTQLQKPLMTEHNMMEPDKHMRSLFKSKQIIQLPEERKERRRTIEEERKKEDNPYQEFFILVDMKHFYREVVDAKIPFNLWYRWVERKLLEIYDTKKKANKTKKNSIYKRFKNCFFFK